MTKSGALLRGRLTWFIDLRWPVPPQGPTWLVIAPASGNRAFTVVVGRWGLSCGWRPS